MDVNELIKILSGVLILLIVTYFSLIFNKKSCIIKTKQKGKPLPRVVPNGLESQYVYNQFSSCDTTGFMNFKHY